MTGIVAWFRMFSSVALGLGRLFAAISSISNQPLLSDSNYPIHEAGKSLL